VNRSRQNVFELVLSQLKQNGTNVSNNIVEKLSGFRAFRTMGLLLLGFEYAMAEVRNGIMAAWMFVNNC
jgi:hypothetical protein